MAGLWSSAALRSISMTQSPAGLKFTFLSKWTVLFRSFTFQTPVEGINNPALGVLLLLLAILVYAIAWIVGFIDSIQEKAYGWTVALFLLLPFFVGPLLYSFFGPKNTR